MNRYIIVCGNLSEGFSFHGPYESFDDADEASRDMGGIGSTWIARLHGRNRRHLDRELSASESDFVKRIQDALGTAEEGEALIEVARNAHAAEMELAARILADMRREPDHSPD